ncbi:hypothetical protein Glove_146g30 [Diversispora epigaea]|uniref:Uncharacterized protein n=1 Tax=Diversispora epigaea TaxID=1348612 RepID=A0A397IXS9_9GLOM|nr:hypothetical protein Glove_146g30 [Diversispora epigaea]
MNLTLTKRLNLIRVIGSSISTMVLDFNIVQNGILSHSTRQSGNNFLRHCSYNEFSLDSHDSVNGYRDMIFTMLYDLDFYANSNLISLYFSKDIR